MTRSRTKKSKTTAGEVARALDGVAPFALAEEWDNVGLLAGRPEWSVSRGLLAMDLTDAVAREALQKKADALVLYHPPIFKGIKSVTPDAATPTTLLPDLLAARVSLFALHTALDAAPDGTNDVLLDAFDVVERRPLEPTATDGREFKLVVFAPPAEVEGLRTALSAAGAGVIGHYSECSYELDGRGTFKGDATTKPVIGRKQRLETVQETRLEMIAPRARLDAIVRTLYERHSYEEPAFDLYPLRQYPHRAMAGMGRVGRLRRPTKGTTLFEQLARVADASAASVVGDLKRTFDSVTAAAGAFGVRAFRDSRSLVVTGEFKHHDALDLMKRGVTAVHLGHDASERPVLRRILWRLTQDAPEVKWEIARSDRSPFATPRRAKASTGKRGA